MDRPPIDAKLEQLAQDRRKIVGVYADDFVDIDLMYKLADFSAEDAAQETSTDPKIIEKAREVDELLKSYKAKHKALLEAAAEAQKSLDAAKRALLALKKDLQNDLEKRKISESGQKSDSQIGGEEAAAAAPAPVATSAAAAGGSATRLIPRTETQPKKSFFLSLFRNGGKGGGDRGPEMS
jgi:hypothetical protein